MPSYSFIESTVVLLIIKAAVGSGNRQSFVFLRVGQGLGIQQLPETYSEWRLDRKRHLTRDLAYSQYTAKLFKQYRKHLGTWRYELLRLVQAELVPGHVRRLLGLKPSLLLSNSLRMYPVFDRLRLRTIIQKAILPPQYLDEIQKFEGHLKR